MKLTIKHNNSVIEIENTFKYGSYIDVNQFFEGVISITIDKLNEQLK